jgi:hypothetical protein
VLDTTSGGRDALHVGAVRLFAVSGDGSPLRAPRPPLLAALDVLHDTLLLSGVVSLPPRIGRGLVASLLVAYWAARLRISSVVYLKKSFCAQKGGGGCVLHTLLPNTFGPGPLPVVAPPLSRRVPWPPSASWP